VYLTKVSLSASSRTVISFFTLLFEVVEKSVLKEDYSRWTSPLTEEVLYIIKL